VVPTELTQSATLPEVEPAARASAQLWIYRRRWIAAAAASLIGAVVGFGIVAGRGSRNAAPVAGTSAVRAAALPTAQSLALSSTPAPAGRPDSPSVVGAGDDAAKASDVENKDASAARGATVIPNIERSALPPKPAASGRPLPGAAPQTHKDYGI
jgi:hypothetical protein